MSAPAVPTQPRSAAASARRAGILIALLGMLLFALNDVMGKWLVATYSVGQVLLLRSAAALVVLVPLVWRSRAPLWPLERPWLHAARVAAATLEVYCFYFAVTTLPLADVMTYWLAGPIYVAALSPWLLGERVGPWRWTAILVGFAGVVVALRPGAETLSPAVAVSLLGSAMFAFMVVSARMLRGTADAALVFWQTLGAFVAGVATASIGWVAPTAPGLRCCSACSASSRCWRISSSPARSSSPTPRPSPPCNTRCCSGPSCSAGWCSHDAPDPAILLGAGADHGVRPRDLVARDARGTRRAAGVDHAAGPALHAALIGTKIQPRSPAWSALSPRSPSPSFCRSARRRPRRAMKPSISAETPTAPAAP